jgi:hypothetical protein
MSKPMPWFDTRFVTSIPYVSRGYSFAATLILTPSSPVLKEHRFVGARRMNRDVTARRPWYL